MRPVIKSPLMDTACEAEANVRRIIRVGGFELLSGFYCACSRRCAPSLGDGAGAIEARELGSPRGTGSRGVGLGHQHVRRQWPRAAVCSRVAMPKSKLAVRDGLSLPGGSGTGKLSVSRTSATDIGFLLVPVAVTALRVFFSGSFILFAGRIAASLLLAQRLFPLLSSSRSRWDFSASAAALCKIQCCWRLLRARKMLGSSEQFLPQPMQHGMEWRVLSSRCPGSFWVQLICWGGCRGPQGLVRLGCLTAQPLSLSPCTPHHRAWHTLLFA